jgi:ABC-2 type transport system ATP-binding protein
VAIPTAPEGAGPEAGAEAGPGGTPAVRIEELTKRLHNGVVAVDHLDLAVGRGRVLGLVGPNGSGKTITLRILLGLVRPTAGRVLLFGEEVRPGAAVLGRVGALVDGPGFVPHLSGRRNLELAARQIELTGGRADLERAVALCRLGEAVDRPFSGYSHGMGYRLALAQALLGEPDLLLLDEPTTGMDPAQTMEVHAAIGACAEEGTTVLLSTHRMSEVELVCTDVAVMHAGRLLAAGPVAELVGPAQVLVEVDDAEAAVVVLRRSPGVSGAVVVGAGTVAVVGGSLQAVDLCETVVAAGLAVRGFRSANFADRYAEMFDAATTDPVVAEPAEP